MTNPKTKSKKKSELTRVQRTQMYAISRGYIVKCNAVVMTGLMPSGILARRAHEKEFSIMKLIS